MGRQRLIVDEVSSPRSGPSPSMGTLSLKRQPRFSPAAGALRCVSSGSSSRRSTRHGGARSSLDRLLTAPGLRTRNCRLPDRWIRCRRPAACGGGHFALGVGTQVATVAVVAEPPSPRRPATDQAVRPNRHGQCRHVPRTKALQRLRCRWPYRNSVDRWSRARLRRSRRLRIVRYVIQESPAIPNSPSTHDSPQIPMTVRKLLSSHPSHAQDRCFNPPSRIVAMKAASPFGPHSAMADPCIAIRSQGQPLEPGR